MRGLRRLWSGPASGLARFHRHVESFAESGRDLRMNLYPGLSSQPFHDPSQFAIVAALEAAFPAILGEMRALEATAFHEESEPIARRGSWDVILLYERGRKIVENCTLAPATTQIIESHYTVRTIAGLMYFSRLAPGTEIARHRGPTNVRLRCHLALDVPAGDCKIKVGEETRAWETGTCLVFDDRFPHEAWNRTAGARTVLVVDLWHPDLSEEEIAALEGLHRYALAQALTLGGYWKNNDAARTKKRDGYD